MAAAGFAAFVNLYALQSLLPTLATYFAGAVLRRKISPADIANATLAGGVSIGALCARPDFFAGSFVIGLAAVPYAPAGAQARFGTEGDPRC